MIREELQKIKRFFLRFYIGPVYEHFKGEGRVLKGAFATLVVTLFLGVYVGFRLRGWVEPTHATARSEQVFTLQPVGNGNDEISPAKGPPIGRIFPSVASDYTYMTLNFRFDGHIWHFTGRSI